MALDADAGPTRSVRPAWMEKPTPLSTATKAIVLTLIVAVMLLPFIAVFSVSISDPTQIMRHGLSLIPRGFSLDAYADIFATDTVPRALLVSAGVTVVGTLLSLTLTICMAYGLSRTSEVAGTRFVLYLALGTLLFGAGIIPNFLLVKQLGLLDTYAALMLPTAMNAFNLIVLRNFFMSLPRELIDAAKIDGASDFRILWSIVLPLSKAVIAVIGLFYAVGFWNNFFNGMIYINDPQKWPIQLVLNQYVIQGTAMAQVQDPSASSQSTPEVMRMAILVVATLPILVIYPFLQRFFTKGVLTGAIKS